MAVAIAAWGSPLPACGSLQKNFARISSILIVAHARKHYKRNIVAPSQNCLSVECRSELKGLFPSASRATSVELEAEGDIQLYRPVVNEQEGKLELPSSALAVAAAAAFVSSAQFDIVTKLCDPQRLVSAPSAEFLALCAEQLSLCEKIVGPRTNLTVFVRTAESYATGELEFFFAASSAATASYGNAEAYKVVLVLHDRSESQGSAGRVESALVNREAVELQGLGALVLPLVKDSFLVGILVAERQVVESSLPVVKPIKLKPVRPSWPPKEKLVESESGSIQGGDTGQPDGRRADNSHQTWGSFSKDQQTETAKIARTLGLACVMDQRAVLLQQSSWRKGVRIDHLLEQVRGPLMAVRTLGKMLLPHLKRGEISRDVVEDILVQGDRMSDVVQQIQKSGADYIQYDDVFLKDLNEQTITVRGGIGDNSPSVRTGNGLQRNGALQDKYKAETSSRQVSSTSSSAVVVRDEEPPMPPIALAASPQVEVSQCNVTEVLYQLVRAGSSLAQRRSQTLQFNSTTTTLIAAVEELALRQALSNLLEYSIQHTPEGGWIRADAAKAPGGGVLVVIEDNGPDMGLVVQESVLGPLGSAVKSSVKSGRSTDKSFEAGLKLIAAREALEQSGAVLNIRSPYLVDAPMGAGGTHVEIWLPSRSDEENNSGGKNS
ncbi:hypothetical protein R1sor_000001 [Riccia sorocarpa]|uniref:Histidine kinase/HSP90-like ATPase domain-containing protein n=1 Tax=Riccia sorocarpa TaxID=122646 RepID=A0ABD3GXY1_9MARC